MKRTLLLALVLIAVGCAEPIPRNVDELVQQGETYLDPETFEPYSGQVFGLFPENPSKIESRFNLNDGVQDGSFESYHENGQLREKTTYKNGGRDGPYESWWENGQLREKTTYKDGVQEDGPYEIYWSDGQLWGKGTYKDGEMDGPYESYTDYGRLLFKGSYKDGKLCGEWLVQGETVTYDPCPRS